jgi:pilus assembly protein FimV
MNIMINHFHRNCGWQSGLSPVTMLLSLGLLLTGAVSHAVMLGDLQGDVVIGHGLDVSVQVKQGPGEDVSSSCFTADVFYAETRQRTPRINIHQPAPNEPIAIHIQLMELINEPIVTVEIHAKCGIDTRRSYTLLADMPLVSDSLPVIPQTALAPAPAPGSGTAALVVPQPPVISNLSGASASHPVASQAMFRKQMVRSVKVKKDLSQVNTRPLPNPQAVHATRKPRLKLDPMEIFSDRMNSLHSPMLFAPTEDTLLHAKQLSALQTEIEALRVQAQSSQANLRELRQQLNVAQSQRSSNWMVYGTGMLMLLFLAGLVWLWQRQRQRQLGGPTSTWWYGDDSPASAVQTCAAPSSACESMTAVQAASSVDNPANQPSKSNIDTFVLTEPFMLFGSDGDSDEASTSHAKFESTMPIPVPSKAAGTPSVADESASQAKSEVVEDRRLDAEDILDIRQQADFFVSLGQVERAIDILYRQIKASDDPHPLVFLDLLSLYHALNLKRAFALQTEVFSRYFNCIIPDFEQFTNEGQSLETYTQVVSTIIRLWPHQQILSFLDHCIYRGSEQAHEPFDLAAFRDLLTLRRLAEIVATSENAAPDAPDTPAVVPSELPEHTMPPEPAHAAAPPQPTQVPLSANPNVFLSVPSVFFDLDSPFDPESESITRSDMEKNPDSELITSVTVTLPESAQESPSYMLDLDFSHLSNH